MQNMNSLRGLIYFLRKYRSLKQLKFKFSRRYFSNTVLKLKTLKFKICHYTQLFHTLICDRLLHRAHLLFSNEHVSEFELNFQFLKNLFNPMCFLKFHITTFPVLFSSIRNLYQYKICLGEKAGTESLKQSSISIYFYL